MEERLFTHVQPGGMPSRQTWNRLTAGVARDGRIEKGKTGADARRARCVVSLFELTADAQMPSQVDDGEGNMVDRSEGDRTEPDVPWAEDCMMVIYHPWNADSGKKNQYALQNPDTPNYPHYTLYWPAVPRNEDGIAVGQAPAHRGDRVWATYNVQSGRWEVLFSATTMGFAKLTADLKSSSSAEATLRVRNDDDDDWTDSEATVTLYASDLWPDDYTLDAGQRVEWHYHPDPQFPHLVATLFRCQSNGS